MGGRAPGTPWYVSGYPGAKEYNTLGLSLIPKERLLAAWILIADSDRDSVPNFKDVEISFDEKYQKVAEIIWPVGNKKIEVYKPTLLINSVDVTVHN